MALTNLAFPNVTGAEYTAQVASDDAAGELHHATKSGSDFADAAEIREGNSVTTGAMAKPEATNTEDVETHDGDPVYHGVVQSDYAPTYAHYLEHITPESTGWVSTRTGTQVEPDCTGRLVQLSNTEPMFHLGQRASGVWAPGSGKTGIVTDSGDTNRLSDYYVESTGLSGASLGGATETAPDGRTISKLVEDGTNGVHGTVNTATVTFTTTDYVSLSCWAKAGERQKIRLYCSVGADSVYAYYDLIDGQVGAVGESGLNQVDASITFYGSGWCRCRIKFYPSTDITAETMTHAVRLAEDVSTDVDSYQGDGSSGAWVDGFSIGSQYGSEIIATKPRTYTDKLMSDMGYPAGLTNDFCGEFRYVPDISSDKVGDSAVIASFVNAATGDYLHFRHGQQLSSHSGRFYSEIHKGENTVETPGLNLYFAAHEEISIKFRIAAGQDYVFWINNSATPHGSGLYKSGFSPAIDRIRLGDDTSESGTGYISQVRIVDSLLTDAEILAW